jgi:hypothetical protein
MFMIALLADSVVIARWLPFVPRRVRFYAASRRLVRQEFRGRVLAVLWVLLWLLLPRFWLPATPIDGRFLSRRACRRVDQLVFIGARAA